MLHVILGDRAVCGGFLLQPLVFRDALADRLDREVDAAHVGRQMLERERRASRVYRRARAAWQRYWMQRSSRRVLHGRECFEELLRERPVGESACQANLQAATQLFGRADALSAAFAVPAATLVNWQENRGGLNGPHPTSRWRSLVPTQVLYVCCYDGIFPPSAGPPRPNAQVKPPYDRIDVILDPSGGITVDRAGHKANLPITDPAKP